MKAIRAKVTGKVQGVWYRASTQAEAQRLGVAGTVENLPDDAVLVVAQGEDEAVEALVRWLHRGPPNARVDGVAVEAIAVDPARTDFRVLR